MHWLTRPPRHRKPYLPVLILDLLKLPPEEYRAYLRAQGFGERYIERELEQLERAREAELLPPRPAKPAPPPPPADAGVFEFLLRRRKERRRRTEDHDD